MATRKQPTLNWLLKHMSDKEIVATHISTYLLAEIYTPLILEIAH